MDYVSEILDINGESEPGLTSTIQARLNQIAPVIELVGWSVLGGRETNPYLQHTEPADGIKIVNLKIGARTTFGVHSSLYVGYGRALTFADWYRDLVRVEYRYSF